jgi:epoxyqueuosine reductase
MQCQTICPENKNVEHWVDIGATFSHDETTLLLESTSVQELPERTKREQKRLALIEYLEILPRNLKALIKQENQLIGVV